MRKAEPRPVRAEFVRSFAWLAVVAALGGAMLVTGPDMRRDAPQVDAAWAGGSVAASSIERSPARRAETGAGWLATFTSGAVEACSIVGHASFAARTGESVHPAIAPSGFNAVYNATLRVSEPGEYRFGAEVEGGRLDLSIFGGALARPIGLSITGDTPEGRYTRSIELPIGDVRLRYEFTRTGEAPARLRAMWSRDGLGIDGFRPEPIPVAAVAPGSEDADIAASLDRGRVLLAELGCVNCHASEGHAARSGPYLGGIGDRAGVEWLMRWIRDPQALKPGSSMPGVFTGRRSDDREAEAIVHYLLSHAGDEPGGVAATESSVLERGNELYHTVGCVSCHGPMGDESARMTPRAPFGDLTNKWKPAALSRFLQTPHLSRPSGRMPSLLLNEEEADAIANFLVGEWGAASESFEVSSGQIRAGERAFIARGCAACHDMSSEQPVESALAAREFSRLRTDRGCLRPGDDRSPSYTLTPQDRADLSLAIQETASWASHAAPTDRAHTTLDALNCRACHQRDGVGGPPNPIRSYFTAEETVDPGDEGRIPPHLEGVGAKLTTSWMRSVIGEGARARPYTHTRMPVFGDPVESLAADLAKADGVWADRDIQQPQSTDEAVSAGRALAGVTAYNCISCHAFADRPLAGSAGPNMVNFAERLRYDWWNRYMHNPGRFKPGTRMTGFFLRNDGLANNTEILDGDPQAQSDALWAYLNLGELFMPAPEGVPTGGGLELLVGDQPRVFRTFLRNAGARGIAVGFPSGVHFAFDARTCRLAEVWRGKFLDASGAWAGRGGQVTGGQGPSVWEGADGATMIPVPAADPGEPAPDADVDPKFRGYLLGSGGTPTFRYTAGPPGATGEWRLAFEDRFEPADSPGALFQRSIRVDGLTQERAVWLNLGPGDTAVLDAGGAEIASQITRDGSKWILLTDPTGRTHGSTTVTLEIKQ